MQLTYRGIRYEVQSFRTGSTRHSNLEVRRSSLEEQFLQASLPPTVTLKYRGLEYINPPQKSTAPSSDPELESFIAAFWAIVDA